MRIHGKKRLTLALLPLALPLIAAAGPADLLPLVDKVRAATAQYKNVNVALHEGFVQGTPCVSGPDFGAMGVHFVLPERINNAVLSADQPEALIYEPMAGGALRFVGVEFIILAGVWQTQHPTAGPPALDGHLLNFVAAPNRYGLPAFYELHVWAWKANPHGAFADMNPQVTCEHASAPHHTSG